MFFSIFYSLKFEIGNKVLSRKVLRSKRLVCTAENLQQNYLLQNYLVKI